MTWNYDGDPADNERDEVRYLAGDTDTNEQLKTDEEIAYAIAEEANIKGAAANICEAIAAMFSREVSTKAGASGELRLDLQQKAEAYAARALGLRKAAMAYATPICGGISIDDKDDQVDDTDRVKPFFKRDMFLGEEEGEQRTETWQEE